MLQHSSSRVSIYYGSHSDIRVKSYCRLNWLRASTFNFEGLDILRDSVQHSISSVSLYYGTQSDIRVNSYCRLDWLRGSTFNFERLVILWDSIRHSSKKLLLFELAKSFNIQFRTSRYIMGLNQSSE